ncbi:monodehydroascorbate reductase [Tanacetum coccineum]
MANAEQAPARASPVRTDEQIVPRNRWVPIGKSNCYLNEEKSQRSPIFKIAVDILKQTNFFRAFTASSTIPAIYIQQFWDTIRFDSKAGSFKCQLDEQWFNLNQDTLRDALKITPVEKNRAFSSPPYTGALGLSNPEVFPVRHRLIMVASALHELEEKFRDGTLQQIDEALDYRVKEFQINRTNPGFWTKKDVDRSKDFIVSLSRKAKTRRIFRNLESFVGGRIREGDYRVGSSICANMFSNIDAIIKGERNGILWPAKVPKDDPVFYLIGVIGLVWLEHPKSTHDEDGNPSRANIKQALGTSVKLVWHYEAKGRCTVKSGYRQALLQHKNRSVMMASSSLAPNRSFWKELWNLKTLPRVKFFWWKACSNALETHENLSRRGCNCSPICTICCTSVETVEHMLFECPWTKLVCFGSPLGLRFDATHGSIISRVQALLELVYSKSERMKLHTSLANIVWQIWKSRNGKIFNACQLCPRHAISSANLMVSDFNSVFPTSYPTSSALVYHDVPQKSSFRSIRSACHLAISQGWQNATIESDSKLDVSFAFSKADSPWAVAAIVDDIKLWESQLVLSFSWVNRDCNLAVHHVAKIAFNSHVNFVWDVTFPVEITSIARSDI